MVITDISSLTRTNNYNCEIGVKRQGGVQLYPDVSNKIDTDYRLQVQIRKSQDTGL